MELPLQVCSIECACSLQLLPHCGLTAAPNVLLVEPLLMGAGDSPDLAVVLLLLLHFVCVLNVRSIVVVVFLRVNFGVAPLALPRTSLRLALPGSGFVLVVLLLLLFLLVGGLSVVVLLLAGYLLLQVYLILRLLLSGYSL